MTGSTVIASSSSKLHQIPASISATYRRSCEAAYAAGAIVAADNTTMTPFGQRPLNLGADIVIAADTKAPNGHSDALFGHPDSTRVAQARRRNTRIV